MINIGMTIREAIAMASSSSCTCDMYERIVTAIENACGEATLNVTLRSLPSHQMIPVIKALRLATGWGLKESKDFCDVVRGTRYVSDGVYAGGTPNTLRLKSEAARDLVSGWKALGCDVVTDTFNC